jgi:hypothetical protein
MHAAANLAKALATTMTALPGIAGHFSSSFVFSANLPGLAKPASWIGLVESQEET